MKPLLLAVLLMTRLFTSQGLGQAANPGPADGSVVDALPSVFSWGVVPGSLRYEVYLGETFSAVTGAVPESPEFAGAFTAPEFSPRSPGKVSTCYFWRVDVVTNAATLKGPVWRVLTRAPQTAVAGAAGLFLAAGAVAVVDGDNAIWADGDYFAPSSGGLTIARRVPGRDAWKILQRIAAPGGDAGKFNGVALSGERAAASSAFQRSVYFFVRNSFTGYWEPERTVTAPSAAEGFGFAVAGADGVIAAGLPFAAAGTLTNAGAVELYDWRTGVKTARIQAGAPARDSYFGRRIRMSGRWMAVDGGGYVHLFQKDPLGVWSQVTRFAVPGGESAVIALDGDYMAFSSQLSGGPVELYRFDTAWTKIQSFSQPNPRTQFGGALSLRRDTLAIAESNFTDGETDSVYESGRIHLLRYVPGESSWHALAPVRTRYRSGNAGLGAVGGRWLLTQSYTGDLPQSFVIHPEMGTAPVFASLPVLFAEAGTLWSYNGHTVPGEHQSGGVSVAMTAGPAWLTIENKGSGFLLEGTPGATNSGPVQIELTATGSDGQTTQQIFTLKVVPAGRLPRIVSLSEPQSVVDGQPVMFTVQAGGGGAFTYQWMLDGVSIPGATGATLVIPRARDSDAGEYSVRVSNSDASIESSTVRLTVVPKADRFGGDFPTLGRDAARSGYYPATLGAHLWQTRWVTQLMTGSFQFGAFNSQAAVGGGRVFAVETHPSGPGALVALDLRTGAKLWSYSFPQVLGSFGLSPPTFFQGRVYLQRGHGLDDSRLFCFDAAAGTVAWQAPFTTQAMSFGAPAVTKHGSWVSGGEFGGLYHFDLNGRMLDFNTTLGQMEGWTPALADGLVLTGVGGHLRAFDGFAMEVFDEASDFTGNSYATNVSVVDGVAIMSDGSGTLAVDVRTKNRLWQLPVHGVSMAPPARRDGWAYVMMPQQVRAFDAATGTAGPVFDTGLTPVSGETLLNAPIVTDDALIAATDSRTFIFRRSDALLLATLPKGGYCTFSDGWLVLTRDGSASAFYANGSPEFDDAVVPDYTVDENAPLDIPVIARDLDGDTVSLTAAPLPGWLTLNAGRLSGTPGDYDTGDFDIVLSASDGVVPQPATKPMRIHVNPVPDPPAVRPLPTATAGFNGLPLSIDVSTGFTDPDAGDVLSYSVVGNTNAAIFRNLTVGLQTGLLEAVFAPYIAGSATVTIRATGTDTLSAENSILIILPELPPPVITVTQNAVLSRQTGLLEWSVTVTNNAARAIGGFELDLPGLPAGAVLHNASGQRGNGNYFIHHGQPVEPGASLTVVLEFYHPERSSKGLPPSITAQTILPDTTTPEPGNAEAFRIDRIVRQPDALLLEFPAVPGKSYQIEYSPDGVVWQASPVPLRAAGTRVQWLDRGPPRTSSAPLLPGSRFYRVREMAP